MAGKAWWHVALGQQESMTAACSHLRRPGNRDGTGSKARLRSPSLRHSYFLRLSPAS